MEHIMLETSRSIHLELIPYLRTKADAKGIPTLNSQEWKELNQKFNKEEIIYALTEYVEEYKPEPPILPITKKEMEDNFRLLKNTHHSKFFLPMEKVKGNVLEKFNDYGKPFDQYGLGMVQMGNSYLDVSNYFNQNLRLNCDTYGFRSAHWRWKNATDLRPVFQALWRLGNDKLDEKSIVGAFRLSTYIATQFKPHVAKYIYDSTDSKIIFDSSCGWGDRLAGFYCSNALAYYGCDPNPETFEMYKKQCVEYERLLGCNNPDIIELNGGWCCTGVKSVALWRCAAEDFEYDLLPIGLDCAFTSPPYFSTERYNEGGKYEEDQSWSRYDTYEKWRDNFYIPVNEKTFDALKDGGIQIVNIQDPVVNKSRYYASDDLIEYLNNRTECKFLGNLGMRIMQRPKNISKDKLHDLFGKYYIEPCWCFGKHRKLFDMGEKMGIMKYLV